MTIVVKDPQTDDDNLLKVKDTRSSDCMILDRISSDVKAHVMLDLDYSGSVSEHVT